MFWLYNGERTIAPSFPWAVIGRDIEIAMALYNDSGTADVTNACLFVDSEHLGRVWIRTDPTAEYKRVETIGNPNGYIGRVSANSYVWVFFKITSLPTDHGAGLFYFPIHLSYGVGAQAPNYMFFDGDDDVSFLWTDCPDSYPLWLDDPTDQPGVCALPPIPIDMWGETAKEQWSNEAKEQWV